MGSSGTQYQTLTNYGHSTVTISQATVTGAGFGLSGLSLPVSLRQGESVTFSVTFNPKVGGDTSGAISVVSNASNPNLAVALSGTGVSAGRLTSSAGALDFRQRDRGHEQGHDGDAYCHRIKRDHHVGDFDQFGVSSGWIVSAHDPRRRTERPGFADLHTAEQRCDIGQHFARQQRRQYTGGRDSVWVGYGSNAVTHGQSSLESQHFAGGGIQRISQLNAGWPLCEDQSGGGGQHQLSGQFGSKWKDLLLRQYSGQHGWDRKPILEPVASHDSQSVGSTADAAPEGCPTLAFFARVGTSKPSRKTRMTG